MNIINEIAAKIAEKTNPKKLSKENEESLEVVAEREKIVASVTLETEDPLIRDGDLTGNIASYLGDIEQFV